MLLGTKSFKNAKSCVRDNENTYNHMGIISSHPRCEYQEQENKCRRMAEQLSITIDCT